MRSPADISGAEDFAGVAALIGEPTRAAMLMALLDGKPRPAGELAQAAGLSAAATSLHLAKLTRGGLLAVQQQGRHRYYRLARPEVGRALEALGAVVTAARGEPARPRDGRRSGPVIPGAPLGSPERRAFCTARTCFDHLAGALAIELAALLEREQVVRGAATPRGRDGDGDRYELGARGARWLADELRIDVGALASGRRPLARRCLDWTERRPHVAGALGAALLQRLLRTRWLVTTETRALRISPLGRAGLQKLGVPREALVR
jgi:DNA-binding transcriptional ArsR family regulator